MKGFVSFIAVIAIFIVSILIINVNYQINETMSFKEEMLNSKIIMTNYELALSRAMENQNLNTAEIDGNSDKILEKILPSFTNCSAQIKSRTILEAEIELTCNTNIEINNTPIFQNTFSKIIIIKN